MVPQRSPDACPHFADEDTESESSLNLPKVPGLTNTGARNPPLQPEAQALPLNHTSLYSAEMFSRFMGKHRGLESYGMALGTPVSMTLTSSGSQDPRES